MSLLGIAGKELNEGQFVMQMSCYNMEKKRKLKIKCDCDTYFEERIVKDKFYYPIMVCPTCNHKVFTAEQAKQYVRLERMHEKLKRKHKIIRIGNALGITLPRALGEIGVKEGGIVTFQQLGRKTLKLVFT